MSTQSSVATLLKWTYTVLRRIIVMNSSKSICTTNPATKLRARLGVAVPFLHRRRGLTNERVSRGPPLTSPSPFRSTSRIICLICCICCCRSCGFWVSSGRAAAPFCCSLLWERDPALFPRDSAAAAAAGVKGAGKTACTSSLRSTKARSLQEIFPFPSKSKTRKAAQHTSS